MFCLFFCLEFYFGKLQMRKFPFKDIKFNGQFIGKWNQVSALLDEDSINFFF